MTKSASLYSAKIPDNPASIKSQLLDNKGRIFAICGKMQHKRTLSWQAQLLEIRVCYKERGFYQRQGLKQGCHGILGLLTSIGANKNTRSYERRFGKECRNHLTWVQMVHTFVLPQLKLHPELSLPLTDSPFLFTFVSMLPYFVFGSFLRSTPVHLHITSSGQFWRMKLSHKGRWLITPHWDRDASL